MRARFTKRHALILAWHLLVIALLAGLALFALRAEGSDSMTPHEYESHLALK